MNYPYRLQHTSILI